MDIFARNAFKEAFRTLLLILFSLTALVWVVTALRELKLVTSQGQGAWIFFQITLYALPNLISVIAPVALLIAAIFTLHRLNSDSELIVINASGAPIWRIGKPFVLLSILVAIALALSNFYLMPASLRALQELVIQVRTDLISQVLQPGRFSNPGKGMTIYIRARGGPDTVLGLIMHDRRNRKNPTTYLAEQARIVKKDDQTLLIMSNGQIHSQQQNRPGIQVVKFDKYQFDIGLFGPKEKDTPIKPRARYLNELLNPSPDDPLFKNNPGKFRAELHERIASIFYPIVFVLIAIATLGQPRTTRQGRVKAIILGIALAVGARFCGLVATNLAALKAEAVILVYAIPVGAIIMAAVIAQIRMKPQKGTSSSLWWWNLLSKGQKLFGPATAPSS